MTSRYHQDWQRSVINLPDVPRAERISLQEVFATDTRYTSNRPSQAHLWQMVHGDLKQCYFFGSLAQRVFYKERDRQSISVLTWQKRIEQQEKYYAGKRNHMLQLVFGTAIVQIPSQSINVEHPNQIDD